MKPAEPLLQVGDRVRFRRARLSTLWRYLRGHVGTICGFSDEAHLQVEVRFVDPRKEVLICPISHLARMRRGRFS